MQNERQLVTIKGTKEGFVFELDDEHFFEDVFEELEEKLSANTYHVEYGEHVSVIVRVGYRYLDEEKTNRLRQLIEHSNQFYIERFDSHVLSKQKVFNLIDQTSIKLINQIVRSGQKLDINGDLLLVGDVNPGGHVSATGNIFIMGRLHGIAHAGVNGDHDAVVVASYMDPSQLRIGKYFSRSPDYETAGLYMECGYYDQKKEQILIEKLQVLPQVRKELRNLERRVLDG